MSQRKNAAAEDNRAGGHRRPLQPFRTSPPFWFPNPLSKHVSPCRHMPSWRRSAWEYGTSPSPYLPIAHAGWLMLPTQGHVFLLILERASLGDLSLRYCRDFPPPDLNFRLLLCAAAGLVQTASTGWKNNVPSQKHLIIPGDSCSKAFAGRHRRGLFCLLSMAWSNLGGGASANRTFAIHLPGGTIRNPSEIPRQEGKQPPSRKVNSPQHAVSPREGTVD